MNSQIVTSKVTGNSLLVEKDMNTFYCCRNEGGELRLLSKDNVSAHYYLTNGKWVKSTADLVIAPKERCIPLYDFVEGQMVQIGIGIV